LLAISGDFSRSGFSAIGIYRREISKKDAYAKFVMSGDAFGLNFMRGWKVSVLEHPWRE